MSDVPVQQAPVPGLVRPAAYSKRHIDGTAVDMDTHTHTHTEDHYATSM